MNQLTHFEILDIISALELKIDQLERIAENYKKAELTENYTSKEIEILKKLINKINQISC